MSDTPTPSIPPLPKWKPPDYRNNWFLIVVALAVVLLVVIGAGVEAMSNNQNAQVAKVQLQVKGDQNAAATRAA